MHIRYKNIRKNLNITIRQGTKLAVAGLNGAGKSTFVKLLMRLYEPSEGRILLNGIDIRELNKNEYFDLFAPVFQNIELYAFRLTENITMQKHDFSDKKRVEECLSDAGLEKKVSELPNGMDTQLLKAIYDDGVELSGGVKNRRWLWQEYCIRVLPSYRVWFISV